MLLNLNQMLKVQIEFQVVLCMNLNLTNDVPALIIAAPPSLENFEDVTGFSPFEKTFCIFLILVLSSNLMV